MNSTAKDFLIVLFFITAFVIILICILYFIFDADRESSAAQACLEAGYPRTESVKGSLYCVRTVNGTDEVVPLGNLE